MNKEDKVFVDKLVKSQKLLTSHDLKLKILIQKIVNHKKKYFLKIDKIFTPIIKKINLTPNTSYKILNIPNTNSRKIQIYKNINPNKTSELVFEIFIKNFISTPISNIEDIKIDFKYYTSYNSFEWELEKQHLVGEISKLLLKHHTKIISKIKLISTDTLRYFKKLEPKISNLSKKKSELSSNHLKLHSSRFYIYLRNGLTLLLKPFVNPNITPFSLNVNETFYKNIIKLKLLEDNKLQIVTVESIEKPIEHIHVLQIDHISNFIDNNLINYQTFPYISSPPFYRDILLNKYN